ncbi:MAG: hypothetical protein QOG62_977 [Thermoleophilaceae bacterium]|nr:hypothetical protein [Thermoleophilaceae bacterium]
MPVHNSEVRAVQPIGAALERPMAAQLAAPVVAAAGGFLLGMATFVIVRVLRRREPARLTRRKARRRGQDVMASRSFLVDVHLLRR